jgi:hypothetical protein
MRLTACMGLVVVTLAPAVHAQARPSSSTRTLPRRAPATACLPSDSLVALIRKPQFAELREEWAGQLRRCDRPRAVALATRWLADPDPVPFLNGLSVVIALRDPVAIPCTVLLSSLALVRANSLIDASTALRAAKATGCSGDAILDIVDTLVTQSIAHELRTKRPDGRPLARVAAFRELFPEGSLLAAMPMATADRRLRFVTTLVQFTDGPPHGNAIRAFEPLTAVLVRQGTVPDSLTGAALGRWVFDVEDTTQVHALSYPEEHDAAYRLLAAYQVGVQPELRRVLSANPVGSRVVRAALANTSGREANILARAWHTWPVIYAYAGHLGWYTELATRLRQLAPLCLAARGMSRVYYGRQIQQILYDGSKQDAEWTWSNPAMSSLLREIVTSPMIDGEEWCHTRATVESARHWRTREREP